MPPLSDEPFDGGGLLGGSAAQVYDDTTEQVKTPSRKSFLNIVKHSFSRREGHAKTTLGGKWYCRS